MCRVCRPPHTFIHDQHVGLLRQDPVQALLVARRGALGAAAPLGHRHGWAIRARHGVRGGGGGGRRGLAGIGRRLLLLGGGGRGVDRGASGGGLGCAGVSSSTQNVREKQAVHTEVSSGVFVVGVRTLVFSTYTLCSIEINMDFEINIFHEVSRHTSFPRPNRAENILKRWQLFYVFVDIILQAKFILCV